MSSERHGNGLVVTRFELPSGHRFDRHAHKVHQLAWAAHGVVTMRIEERVWVLPRSRGLWIPAATPHEVLTGGPTTMMGVYFGLERCPIRWAAPTVVDTGGLLGSLLEHLASDLPATPRRHVEAVVFDLLQPLQVATIDVPMPLDARAVQIATALELDPADNRSLAEWGRSVGASARTLARVIERETGMGFERWRTQVRIAAALARLAAGAGVTRVALDVGYASSSAFVAAFRRTTGTTPGAYFETGR